MKFLFFQVVLVSLVGGMALSSAEAATVPESGIDYAVSEILIRYTKAEGAADPFVCFGGSWAHSDGDWLFGGDVNPNTLDVTHTRTLSSIGVNTSGDLSNILAGTANACFQQSGIYYVKFRLEDAAGNESYYPNADGISPFDPLEWYSFEIKPTNPHADQTGAPVITGTEVLADNSSFYAVEITLRDEFGNVVTQIDSVADLDLFIATTLSDAGVDSYIEVDGIYDVVNPVTNITHKQSGGGGLTSQIFDNGNNNSETLFSNGVKVGTSSWQNLSSLLNENTDVSDISVNDGVITFNIKSSVPSMKLLGEDPLNGAGVFQQPITFHPKTNAIDINGNPTGLKKDIDGTLSAVTGNFPFHPLVKAEPTIPATGITWAEPVNPVTVAITEIIPRAVQYLFWAPVDQYLIKKNVIEDQGGEIKEVVSFPDLWDEIKTTFDNSSALGSIRIVYEAVTGDVSSALPADIGLGTMVQYLSPENVLIRHHSANTGGNVGCSSYDPNFVNGTDCYAFSGSSEVRNIGADIEGAIQADQSDVLVYQIDDGLGSSGQKTTYAGEIHNDKLKEVFLSNIQRAILNPEAEETSGDVALSDITFLSERVFVVREQDLIIGDGDGTFAENALAPSGKNTVIVVDGNVYYEDNLAYASASDSLGIITYNTLQSRADETWPLTGNVFVPENITKMVGSYYVEGSLISVSEAQYADLLAGTEDAMDLVYSGDKINQLVLEGVIWANNTLGGALITDLYRTPWHNDGTGNLDIAKLFDLHYVRRYVEGGGGTCSGSPCDENKNAFVIRIDNKAAYSETAPPVFSNLSVSVQ